MEYEYFNRIKQLFPEDFDYKPETYSYPEQENIIKEKFGNYTLSKDNLWLIKPKKKSLGEGIHIFQNLTNLPNAYIITKYIENPHLINNLKYDFRVYILITGLFPLKLYLYKEGLIRFATEEYSLDLNKIGDSFVYLTNVELNRKNVDKYKNVKDADSDEASKWSFQVYKNYCKKNRIDFNKIWEQIIDISIKSVLSFKDYFLNEINVIGTKDRNYFKILGYDLDQNLKIHLLDINSRPSFLMHDIIDLKLKPQLIADILNIVGIIPYSHDYKDNFKPYDDELEDEENDDINYIIRDGVERALCEFGRPRGKFELIFPVKESINYYKKFYKYNIEADQLLWEKMFG